MLFMCLSAIFFSSMNALAKLSAGEFGIAQILFFRMAAGLLPAAVFLAMRGGFKRLRTRYPLRHVARSAFGLAAMGLFFQAFALMPLAQAVAISFSLPLFVAVLSMPLLKEPVRMREIAAVCIGFAGVLVVVQPGAGAFTLPALIALSASLLNAVAHLTVRQLTGTDDSAAVVFYFSLAGAVMSAGLLALDWRTPNAADLAILCAVGVCGGIGQCFLVQAYSNGRAAFVAPFEYTNLLWSASFAYLIWGERPGPVTWAGAAIVALSTLYILITREPARAARRITEHEH